MPLFFRKNKAKASPDEHKQVVDKQKPKQLAKRKPQPTQAPAIEGPPPQQQQNVSVKPDTWPSKPNSFRQAPIVQSTKDAEGAGFRHPIPPVPLALQRKAEQHDKAARILGFDKQHADTHHVGDLNDELRGLPSASRVNSRAVRPQQSFNAGSRPDNSFPEHFVRAPASHEIQRPDEMFRRHTSIDALPKQPSFREHAQDRIVRRQASNPTLQTDQVRPENQQNPPLPHEATPHRSMPSFSAPIPISRSTLSLQPDMLLQQEPTFMGYNPTIASHQPEDGSYPSPAINPHFQTLANDVSSLRSLTPQSHNNLLRHARRSGSISLPPFAMMEGLKVNRRGLILDEEGDPIGELIEGDLLDCVRQKVNAFGEVLDDFGRPVGRVRILPRTSAVDSPVSLHPPSAQTNWPLDSYFDANAHIRHSSITKEQDTKHRTGAAGPNVPALPSTYQHLPPQPAHRGSNTSRAELDASRPPVDEDNRESMIDLSEPFVPLSPVLTEAKSTIASPSHVQSGARKSQVIPQNESPSQEHEPFADWLQFQRNNEVKQEQTRAQVEPQEKRGLPASKTPLSHTSCRDVYPTPTQPATKPKVDAPTLATPPVLDDKLETSVSTVVTTVLETSNASLSTTTASTSCSASNNARDVPGDAQILAASQPHIKPSLPAEKECPVVETSPPVKEVAQSPEVVALPLQPLSLSHPPIIRSMSDSTALSLNRAALLPSLPETSSSEHSTSSSPVDAPSDRNIPTVRPPAIRARTLPSKAPPLPPFPRASTGLPPSPFAAAARMNGGAAIPSRRTTLAGRPLPSKPARSSIHRQRLSLNAPLVSSPLGPRNPHNRALSTIASSNGDEHEHESSEQSPPDSDATSDKAKSDAISAFSVPAPKPRTYFTHQGRVTVEPGEPLPSNLKDMMNASVVEVVERPLTSDGIAAAKKSKEKMSKKGRFSLQFGRKKTAVAA